VRADIVLRQAGTSVTACNISGGSASNCSLDGTGSQPSGSIATYQWSTTRFRNSGGNITTTYSGPTPSLGTLACTQAGNTQERFDVTLVVTTTGGIANQATATFSIARAACGS